MASAPSSLWRPQTVIVPMTGDGPVQLLHREPRRPSGFIANLSGAMLGTAAILFLFENEQQAKAFSSEPALKLANGFQGVGIPDGAGYNLTHSEAVWAIAYGAGDAGVASMSTVAT